MKIYTASKTKHAYMWRDWRWNGFNIISTWIDESGKGESNDLEDLTIRCIEESKRADILILYCEPGEVLKGALIEAGAALASGTEVRQVGSCDSISKVFHSHPLWKVYPALDMAFNDPISINQPNKGDNSK